MSERLTTTEAAALLEAGFPCAHFASTQETGSDLWTCDECGQVSRFVPDPNGEMIVSDRLQGDPNGPGPHGGQAIQRTYLVREEIITPGRRLEGRATCDER